MATDAAQLPVSRLQVLGMIAPRQKVGLMVAVASIVALVVAGWLWGQSPDYRVLYANLSDRDGGAIISSLQQMNVPFKFADGGGALLVPANQVHEVRLRLAGQGLPKGGLVGFEVMESQKLGTSQFQEQVNYQRALEGELARSIQSLAAVNGARVHLAFSKPSVFVREQQKPSASVLLSLHPGRTLDPGQVSAIVHLVSSSIPDLPIKNVTVIDQGGNLLTAQDVNSVGLDPGQLKYLRDVEQSFVKRVEAILTPITGPNNVLAQVTADIDFSQSENIAEIFNPNQSASAAVRSQQTTESSGSGTQGASGVPGALSNQPPSTSGAPANAASAPQTAQSGAIPGATRRDSTTNYEVDKTIRHTRQATGAIKRLSVAVVVNHRKLVDAQGKVTTKALAPAEMEQIDALVKEVMGYNKERGDSLKVTNSAFTAGEVEKIVEAPLWKQPDTIALAKETGRYLLIGSLLLFLVLKVLRPMLATLSEVRPAELSHSGGGGSGGDGNEPAQHQLSHADNLEAARQLARSEPKLVASVVKEWVNKDG
ncbi:MAG: flagellar basal-body MS-ring/collar protein FliF [Comamonadaceae bacterium]|jgi:flagellar M-ring protein FliF